MLYLPNRRLHFRPSDYLIGCLARWVSSSSVGALGTWIDPVGGYNAVLKNDTIVTAGIGLITDGGDDRADIPDDVVWGISALTVSCWIKPNSTAVAFVPVIRGTGTPVLDISWTLYYDAANDRYVSYISTSGSSWAAVRNSATQYTDTGVWKHLVLVWNPATRLDIFIDGILDNGTLKNGSGTPITDIPDTVYDGSSGIGLAGNWNENVNNFDGTLDDVRVYNVALTASQVKQVYDATRK